MKSKALLFLLLPLIGHAQNLVPNGSFEEYTECPNSVDAVPVLMGGWNHMFNTPDYMNECANPSGIGVPFNQFLGFQNPKDGAGYCGFVADAKVFTDEVTKEVIIVPLLEPLEIGIEYYFSMWLVRSDYEVECQRACNNIGAKFLTSDSFSFDEVVNNSAHFNVDTVFRDTANWKQLKGAFVADSAYNFLSIGSFYLKANSIQESYDSQFDIAAYYGIDDVRLSRDSTYIESSNVDLLLDKPNAWFDNSSSTIIVNSLLQTNRWKIFGLDGRLIQDGNCEFSCQIRLSILPQGLYIFVLESEDGKTHRLKFFNSN